MGNDASIDTFAPSALAAPAVEGAMDALASMDFAFELVAKVLIDLQGAAPTNVVLLTNAAPMTEVQDSPGCPSKQLVIK